METYNVFFLCFAEYVQMRSGNPKGWKSVPKSNTEYEEQNCLFHHSGKGRSGQQLQKPFPAFNNEMKSNVMNQ